MGVVVSAVKYILDALQTNFDGVVADSGGDYTTIQAADDALDAGDFSLLVRTGTYAGWTTSTDDAYIVLAPGTVITSAIELSGDNVTLIVGPGCDIQALVTLSGVGCHMICQNACDLDGVLMSGNFGYLNGGGWDTLSNGAAAVDGVKITGADCIVENIAVQTTAGGGNTLDGVSAEGARGTVRKVKVVDSDNIGIVAITGSDTLVEECIVLGADLYGISAQVARTRMTGNYVIATGNDCLRANSNGDNSVFVGNIAQDPAAGAPIQLEAGADNCVVVGNRTDGAIADASTGSTVADNDSTAF